MEHGGLKAPGHEVISHMCLCDLLSWCFKNLTGKRKAPAKIWNLNFVAPSLPTKFGICKKRRYWLSAPAGK